MTPVTEQRCPTDGNVTVCLTSHWACVRLKWFILCQSLRKAAPTLLMGYCTSGFYKCAALFDTRTMAFTYFRFQFPLFSSVRVWLYCQVTDGQWWRKNVQKNQKTRISECGASVGPVWLNSLNAPNFGHAWRESVLGFICVTRIPASVSLFHCYHSFLSFPYTGTSCPTSGSTDIYILEVVTKHSVSTVRPSKHKYLAVSWSIKSN